MIVARHPMGLIYYSTMKGTAYKTHQCGECAEMYGYVMVRVVTSYGDYAATARREVECRVREQLSREFECIPCPHCGAFQDEMTDQMSRRATSGHLIGAVVLGVLAVPPLMVAGLSTLSLLVAPVAGQNAYEMCVGSWLAAGLFTLAAGVLLLIRQRVNRAFDPYKGRPARYWMKRARKLGAMTSEELEVAEAKQRALEAEEREEEERRTGAPADKNPFDFS